MAWVGFQDSAMNKLKRLSFLSGMTRAQVLCALSDLWYGTQTEFIIETTKEEILFFAFSNFDEVISDDQKNRFFDATIRLNFVTKIGDALYKINGNADHIAKIKSAKLKSARGHDAKRLKKESLKTKQNLHQQNVPGAMPETMPQALPEALPDSDTDSDSDSDSEILKKRKNKKRKNQNHNPETSAASASYFNAAYKAFKGKFETLGVTMGAKAESRYRELIEKEKITHEQIMAMIENYANYILPQVKPGFNPVKRKFETFLGTSQARFCFDYLEPVMMANSYSQGFDLGKMRENARKLDAENDQKQEQTRKIEESKKTHSNELRSARDLLSSFFNGKFPVQP